MSLLDGTTPVRATLFLRVGAELHEEPWREQALDSVWRDAALHGGIDGGLALGVDAQPAACRPDLWDQIDGLLLAWLTALDAIGNGATTATVNFPDTRIEAELARLPDDRVHVVFEDVDAILPLAAAQQALRDAARRLLDTAPPHVQSPALIALNTHLAEAP